ncbi:ATP-binding protein [Maridesulfovibrio sp.]|uniref:ATP-binding protein n=1 Tax=Maridesulfovibrio sp. TaxID=2795000 RepID=UPI002A18B62A|nr:ATP-binding protein [Maridesulfovibrio sp.]
MSSIISGKSYQEILVVSDGILERWQSIVDLLAEFSNVPAALIMRVGEGLIEVFRTSASEGNPYPLGATEHYYQKCGLYCEHVIRTDRKLLVPNALEDPDWKDNPDVALNMISYLGFPILYPDSTPFGTICVLDNKFNAYSPKIENLMIQFRDIIEFQLAQLCHCVNLETELEGFRISERFDMTFPEESSTDPQERLQGLTGALVQANRQLQDEIQMRMQVERELKRAQQGAVAASKAKSEFLANMSHEIRTPLNGIMGMLQLLQHSELDDEQKLYATNAAEATIRLTALLSDILDLSRVEAGKLVIRSAPMNLRDCISAVETIFRPTAMGKNVVLTFDVSPDIPETILGDATRVQQILSNLLGNAVKFTDKGGINIDVHPLPVRKDGRLWVLFTVADTGIGICEDKLDRIFSAFEQQAEGYQRKKQGAGLGLAICKKLLGLMGGTMSVESIENKGSTFYCCLPFQLAGESEEVAPPEPVKNKGKASVLLVEDDCLSRLAVHKYIQSIGLDVQMAGNGKEALEILLKHSFDLILMDIQMPKMDGVSATRAIRSGKAGRRNMNIPIVALTAYAMAGDKDKFLASGFNGYLEKPFTMEDLGEEVQHFLASA